MEPSFTWLDLTGGDRDRMRRVMDLFSEQGTVDEMGLGNLRDALADALFPGTSTIQTRLRYTLFVPWIYQRLEAKRTGDADIAKHARAAEIELVNQLLASDDDDKDGIIGSVAKASLNRLPSSVYWAGMVHWGIFGPHQSQGWYHTHFAALSANGNNMNHADDPGVVLLRQPTWHPRLPKAPKDFPLAAGFALTGTEADFIRGRFEERCPNTLLAWLARKGSAMLADSFWDEPAATAAPAAQATLVELARRFSMHIEGLPLIYNLMLAEQRFSRHGTDQERVTNYRDDITEWALRETDEPAFDMTMLWAFMASRGAVVSRPQRSFLETWSQRLNAVGADIVDSPDIRLLIEKREQALKGPRARLSSPARLLDWSGKVGVGRMDFRWSRTRKLLQDLHEGLER